MSVQTLADIPNRAITAQDNQLLTWLAAVKVATETQLTRRFWPQTATGGGPPPVAATHRQIPAATPA